MRHRAALAWRSPARLRRCRLVRPDDTGTGEVPQSAAKLASVASRLGVVTGGAQQGAGGLVADAVVGQQWRGDGVEDGVDVVVQGADLGIEGGPAPDDGMQRRLGRTGGGERIT